MSKREVALCLQLKDQRYLEIGLPVNKTGTRDYLSITLQCVKKFQHSSLAFVICFFGSFVRMFGSSIFSGILNTDSLELLDSFVMEGGGVLTAERSPARANLHVAFSEKGEVKERREKFLTAKYGSHQMSLIRKRLAVEMWLFDELEKLYDTVVSWELNLR